MAFLEFHDEEVGNTLVGCAHSIDYVYQAEQWLIDMFRDPTAKTIVRGVLFTAEGAPMKEWRRAADGFEEAPLTPGTTPDPRTLERAQRPARKKEPRARSDDDPQEA